ncbi:thiol reductant ABC exporter subunit CydD [Variovorax robiniae]|uniref:Thiol reductant ABC exporter subunit CydD n=1 Tax=Variovorax robiniae TaxID=1836199 RepID=A0ABU8XCE8_9BURK
MTPPPSQRPHLQSLPSQKIGSAVQGVAALLWLPQAALLAWAVDGLASGRGMAAVGWPALGILLLGLLRSACEAWGARRVFAQARAHLTSLRAHAATALAAGSPSDRTRAPSGLAASVMAEQAEAVVPYLVRYQPARWRVMVVPLAIAAVVASLSWVAALVLLVAAPLIPVFMAIIGMRALAASKAQMVEMGSMNAFLLDRLRGLATLRALGAVDATAERLDASAQSLRQRTMAVLRIAFLSSAVLELFSALGVAMVAAYVGFHLLGTLDFGTWGEQLSLGQGLFILLLAPAFFEPLRDLAAVWHDRAAGEAALNGLKQLGHHGLALPGGHVVSGETVHANGAPSLSVRDLHFSHPGESPLFEGFELRIAAGEHVALLGASGSGKTALLSLMAGLLPMTRGEIEIGGVALSDRTAAALRQRIGWMGQKPHVFAGSAEANVALGRRGIGATEVQAAIRFARLASVAQAHPGAALGEGGSGLSGGEAVRLALARIAVHAGADLLLVDEPTAHLDTETAARVADALLALAHGKTLIVATHDPVLAARIGRVVDLDAATMEQAA